MVRDKEKVDAENKSPSDNANKRARSWVATKSAQQETDLRKALGLDRHPDDDKRRDAHGNSRRSGDETTKGTSMVGFDAFGKNEKWGADQVNVANARQGCINAEHDAKRARDEADELRKENEDLIKTLKLASKALQDGKHNKNDLDAFNKKSQT